MIIRTVDETLDRMHIAAANADLESYFDCFMDDGYFIGTDSTERWTMIPDFYNYTKPFFDQGLGWTYTSISRHVNYLNDQNWSFVSPAAPITTTATTADTKTNTHANSTVAQPPLQTVALFDEILSHERFGITRNSGVMVLQAQPTLPNTYVWKIAQYHLTIPIPNCHVDTIVQIIQHSD